MFSRKYYLAVALSAFFVIGLLAAPVNAYRSNRSDMVGKLAERFDLDEAEVQEFFDEHHKEREAMRAALMEERLDEAVAAGTITAAQKDELMALHADMFTRKEEASNLSMEERKALWEEHKEQVKAWEEETGVNMRQLLGKEHGARIGKRMHRN